MGLTGKARAPHLLSKHLGPPKGRGVVTCEPIEKGQYVCKYCTHAVYPVGSELHKELQEEYRRNGEGSFVVETAYSVQDIGRLCFDATRRYRDVGRLINNDPNTYNLRLSTPQFLRGKWRLALVAVRDIKVGQEFTFDYGTREAPWMMTRATTAATLSAADTKHDGGTGSEVNLLIWTAKGRMGNRLQRLRCRQRKRLPHATITGAQYKTAHPDRSRKLGSTSSKSRSPS